MNELDAKFEAYFFGSEPKASCSEMSYQRFSVIKSIPINKPMARDSTGSCGTKQRKWKDTSLKLAELAPVFDLLCVLVLCPSLRLKKDPPAKCRTFQGGHPGA